MKFFRLIALLTTTIAGAQTQPARSQVSGTIASVDAGANQLTLKSDKGETVSVTTTERTLVLRIPPGETDPKKGSKVALSTVSSGDRAVIVGPAPTGNAWNATAVLVMSKSDVASIQEKDAEDWKKRGTIGNVTAVDPATKVVTIASGSHTFTVQPSEKTTWNRYSPDSARFSDAKPSTVAEVKIGDQMRVLGNKSSDGGSIDAEKIVFGSFRQFAATITSVDAAKGELVVKDLATKKPLTVRVESDSTMKKLSPPAARMLAMRYAPRAQEKQAAPPSPGRGAGAGHDVGQMLDSLPALPIAELKPGDAVMISTTQGSDPGRVTAIMLLAGVEPLLTASPTAARDIMSGWNLGGGGGEQ